MNDGDNDVTRQILSGKKTSTRNSFRSAANEIINDPKIREGRIPSQNQVARRRTVLGMKPENVKLDDKQNTTTRKSFKKDDQILSPQRNQSNIDDQDLQNSLELNKRLSTTQNNNLNIKQDILTKQAIEEVKDNIEMFKMDINKYVSELREQQEKIELGDVKQEIKDLEENLTKDLRDTKDQNDNDFRVIKEAFLQFKEEVFQIINKIVKNNELKVEALYNEIKTYEDEVNKRFVQLSDRQEEYINTLKLILETTKDKTTKQLVKQFLVDDEDVYLRNKERFAKEFNERREKEKKNLEEKEKQLLAIRLQAQEKQLEREEAEKEELNELKNEAENREKNLMQKKEEELIKKYEELQKKKDEEEYERHMKMEEDLLNYYNNKEKEDYLKKLEFMKNQARIAHKKAVELLPSQVKTEQNVKNVPVQNIEMNINKIPNYENRLQNEKLSSETMSLVPDSLISRIPRKKKKKKYYDDEEESEPKSKKSKKTKKTKSTKITKKEEPPPVVPEEPPIKPEEIIQVQADDTPQMLSLKEFVKLYTPGEYDLKIFVKNSCKNAIIGILKCQSFAEVLDKNAQIGIMSEVTSESVSQSVSELERKKKTFNGIVLLIIDKIKAIFQGLTDNVTEDNITNEIQEFMQFVMNNDHFVPYKFYSLFEISRLMSNEGYIKNVNSNQKKMIIGIYIIGKILIYYYMMEFNFLREDDKEKIDDDSKLNLKIISSIIFHQLMKMIKSVCKTVSKIDNMRQKRNEQYKISRDIKLFIEKIEKNFISGDPDTDPGTIEYIESELFQPKDFQKLTKAMDKTKFSLSKTIFAFITKFANFIGQ